MKTKTTTTMIKGYAPLLLGFAIFASSCKKNETVAPAQDNVSYSSVSLSSGQESPSPTTVTSTGNLEATYEKNSNKLSYTITYSGLTPTAMHFHKGAVGISGGVAETVSGPYSSGMTGSLTLTDAEEADLLAGLWYLNIHTDANANGEIRGQVVGENIVIPSNIKLDAKQETPSNQKTSSGVFNGWYDKTTKKVTYTMSLSGISATAMHIHKGSIGTSGDVIVTLSESGGTTDAITADQETELLAGNFYVNVHTTENAGGEIRGQVVTENKVVVASLLSPANEVPAILTTTATGTVYTVYDKDTRKLNYVVTYNGLIPTAMHFHKGAIGISGAVELEAVGPYSSGMTGTLTLSESQSADFLAGLWYFNVHTALNAGGEIRAQILK